VPRARHDTPEGKTREWKSTTLRAYQRRTRRVDALIAGAYLAGTNSRRVRRALAAVFGGAVSKDPVSRVSRKIKAYWDAWNARALAEEPIIRLILDGTVALVQNIIIFISATCLAAGWSKGPRLPLHPQPEGDDRAATPPTVNTAAAFGTDYLHSVTDASIDRSESILWTNMGDVMRRLPTRLRTSERNHCGMRGRGS
jgi:hypothetical protein